MNPNESQPATEADLEAAAAEINEETRTLADDILDEVKQCQNQLNEQTAAFQRLQESGATREQVQEALTELRNTRQEMTELMREMREAMRQNQPAPPSSEAPPNPSPDSQPSTPSQQAPALETVNPVDEGAAVQERVVPKRKRRIL